MDTQEGYFQRAYDELRDGDVDSATMGRAIAEANGDEAKRDSLYIQNRVKDFAAQDRRLKAERDAHRRRKAWYQAQRLKQRKETMVWFGLGVALISFMIGFNTWFTQTMWP